MWDLARIAAELSNRNFEFVLVGAISPETRSFLPQLRSHAKVQGKRRQRELPKIYDESDLFVFPTLQDGFAGVLTQAAASGLPILATTNCGAPDFINEGFNGWILPIRSPESFIERLLWCDSHRKELAEMTTRIASEFQPRDWMEVARQFESICMAATRDAANEPAHVG
jgi:glycosyltransferase involved in cell wall biosynthesis